MEGEMLGEGIKLQCPRRNNHRWSTMFCTFVDWCGKIVFGDIIIRTKCEFSTKKQRKWRNWLTTQRPLELQPDLRDSYEGRIKLPGIWYWNKSRYAAVEASLSLMESQPHQVQIINPAGRPGPTLCKILKAFPCWFTVLKWTQGCERGRI